MTNIVARAVEDDGTLSEAELIERYAGGAAAVAQAVAGLTPAQLRARPVEGRWSVLEVVCHLADAEQFFADRIKRTLALERPLLLGVDAGGYAGPLDYQAHDLEEEIRLIETTRAQLSGVLRRAPASAWQRTAVHSELGLLTLRQLVLHAVFHVRHHLRFIEEKRAAMSDAGGGEPVKDVLEQVGALFREGRFAEALQVLTRIAGPLTRSMPLQALRAQIHQAAGDHARAAWTYRRAALDPVSPQAASMWYAAGLEHDQAEEHGAARRCFTEASAHGYEGPEGGESSASKAAAAEARLRGQSYAVFARSELMAASLRALESEPDPSDAWAVEECERRVTVLLEEMRARVPPAPVRPVHDALEAGLAECLAGLVELREGRIAEGRARLRGGLARLVP